MTAITKASEITENNNSGSKPRNAWEQMSSQPSMSSAARPLGPGAIALILVLCLTWAFNQIAIKLALPEIPPMLQAVLRSIGALPVLLLIARFRGVKMFERDGTLGAGLFAGVLFGFEFVADLSRPAAHLGIARGGVSLYGAVLRRAGLVPLPRRAAGPGAMGRARLELPGRGAGDGRSAGRCRRQGAARRPSDRAAAACCGAPPRWSPRERGCGSLRPRRRWDTRSRHRSRSWARRPSCPARRITHLPGPFVLGIDGLAGVLGGRNHLHASGSRW